MTASKLYFENALATIQEHADGYALFTYHASKRTQPDLQAALTHLGNLLRLRRWHRVLSDQHLMQPASVEENTLIADYLLHYTQEVGHGLCVASVLAQDVFARLSAAAMREELKTSHITYRAFENEGNASSWLRTQSASPPLK